MLREKLFAVLEGVFFFSSFSFARRYANLSWLTNVVRSGKRRIVFF